MYNYEATCCHVVTACRCVNALLGKGCTPNKTYRCVSEVKSPDCRTTTKVRVAMFSFVNAGSKPFRVPRSCCTLSLGLHGLRSVCARVHSLFALRPTPTHAVSPGWQ